MPSNLTAPTVTIPANPVKHLIGGDNPTLVNFDALMQSAWDNAASMFSVLNKRNMAVLQWTNGLAAALTITNSTLSGLDNIDFLCVNIQGATHIANGFVTINGFDAPANWDSPRRKIVYNASPWVPTAGTFNASRIMIRHTADGGALSQALAIFTPSGMVPGAPDVQILPGGFAVFEYLDSGYAGTSGTAYPAMWQLVYVYSPEPSTVVSIADPGFSTTYTCSRDERVVQITNYIAAGHTVSVELPTNVAQVWEGRKIRIKALGMDDFATSPAILNVNSSSAIILQLQNHYASENLEKVVIDCEMIGGSWEVVNTHWRIGSNNCLQPGSGNN